MPQTQVLSDSISTARRQDVFALTGAAVILEALQARAAWPAAPPLRDGSCYLAAEMSGRLALMLEIRAARPDREHGCCCCMLAARDAGRGAR